MRKEKSILVVDYKERIIWLDGVITPKMAIRFGKIIRKLNKLGVAPIVLYICGPGGNPWSTLTMMNDIDNSLSPVGCIAHKYVASGCFTLTQAGVFRAALPGTKFVFHAAESLSRGHKADIQRTQEQLGEALERLKFVDVAQFLWFSKRGRPLEIVHRLLKDSALLSVPTAKKFGLIDSHYSKKDFLKDRVKIRKISKI